MGARPPSYTWISSLCATATRDAVAVSMSASANNSKRFIALVDRVGKTAGTMYGAANRMSRGPWARSPTGTMLHPVQTSFASPMPIAHRVDLDARLVIAAGYGVVTTADIFAYQGNVWCQPSVQGFDELVDMTR